MQIEQSLLIKIHELQESECTGLLHLEKENQNIVVCFQHGLIAAAGSSLSELQLGKVLSHRGILQDGALPKLLDVARRKHFLLGKAAVLRKLVEETELKDAVRDQAVQTVAYAMAENFEVQRFEDTSVDLYIPAQLNFERLLLELARNNLRPVQLDPNRLITLRNGHNLSNLPWYPQELSVLSQLKTPRTLQDLAITTGMEYERLSKILCVFKSLRLITQVDAPLSESTAIVKRDGFPFMHLTPEIGDAGLSAKLETFHNPSSFVSEQFKNLKVRIAEMAAQASLRVIAVSSPQAEDGKSLVSINLALSFSKDPNRKVVLVDCDLRNPSLQKFLWTSSEPGLLGYLETDHMQAQYYLRRLEKLFFMTAGGASENPVELLSNPRMQELVAYLKTEFDTVILDCPPFGPISDAQILTGLADGLLMVVRCGKTTYGSMEKALRNFDRSKLIGLVFNDVKPMMFNTQYSYKYYQYSNRAYYPYGSVKKSNRPKNYLD
jgi:capsular exopolysaccharide synthesis family protein